MTIIDTLYRDHRLHDLESGLQILFDNKTLLIEAMTHRSSPHTKRQAPPLLASNERLEFFGDAVIKFVVSEHLYYQYPTYSEGELTKLRSQIISDRNLGSISAALGLGQYLLLSTSESKAGGASRPSLLANVFEALIGALFFDKGLAYTQLFLIRILETYNFLFGNQADHHDNKSSLQEILHSLKLPTPQYTVLKEEGPDHDKRFFVQTHFVLNNTPIHAVGDGRSKKDAEQACAYRALDQIQKLI